MHPLRPIFFFFFSWIFFSAFSLFGQEVWKPGGYAVKEIQDCNTFDISVSRFFPDPEIRYCPEKFNMLNERYPNAGHFYYVHEYGHIILRSGDEVKVDNWACIQIVNMDKGYLIINAFLGHLRERCWQREKALEGYGTPCQRMQRIVQFTLNASPYLCFDEQSGQFVE